MKTVAWPFVESAWHPSPKYNKLDGLHVHNHHNVEQKPEALRNQSDIHLFKWDTAGQ